MYSLLLLQEPADKTSSECLHFDLKTDCISEKSLLSILSWATLRETEIYARDVTIGSETNSFKKNQSLRPKIFQFAAGKLVICYPLFTDEYSLLRTNHCLFSIILAIIITLLFISIWLALDFCFEIIVRDKIHASKIHDAMFYLFVRLKVFLCLLNIALCSLKYFAYKKRKYRKKEAVSYYRMRQAWK